MKIYYTILTSLFVGLAFAQQTNLNIEGAKVDYVSNLTNLPLQVSLDESRHLNIQEFPNWMTNSVIKNSNYSFVALKTSKDGIGMQHTKYEQYFKGYKVERSMLIAHTKNNEVKSFSGDWFKDIDISNKVVLTEQQALQFALKKVKAKKYKWENKEEEAHMQKVLNNPNFSFYPESDLVIYPSIQKDKSINYHYTYKFTIYAEEPLYKANVYVDATSGNIIREQNLICTANSNGTANTKYSGTQTLTTDSYTAGYRLRESARGLGVETYNLNNGSNYGSATDFTNSTNTWTSTGVHQAATDAHFGAEVTYDYYYQTHNRNSIDDAGFKLLSYVHYSNNFVNAFWDGYRMTYGDGNISQGFDVMTALDVCGHEITHGVVEHTAGLNGGEADALNEGFADIFGTSVEWYARPSQHDWIMGKDIMPSGTGIRNMSNPNQLSDPDTYLGNYWDPNDEPHANAGPCIYWFYLLSVGGSGTNDNSQTYSVSGITMSKAEAIAYRALAFYMTPSTDYANVRVCTIQAAKDLYGACSNEVIQTTNAWYAVGVGAQYTTPTLAPAFISPYPSSCSVPALINFTNTTVGGATYTWYFGDGTTSTLENPSHTYSVAGTYTVKLVATGCTANKDSITKNSYIVINPPSGPTTTGASRCGSGTVTLNASGTGVLDWYSAASGGTVINTGTSFTTPTLTNTTTYYVSTTNSVAPINGAPATNTTLGGGSYLNYPHYLTFDALTDLTIKTVDIYASSVGTRTIYIANSSGTTLDTKYINITTTGKNTITLNFHVVAGTNYYLVADGSLIDLYRNNTGATYPIPVGTLASITGHDVMSSAPNYYYYFYNWVVQKDGCTSARTPVTASITASGGSVTVNSASVCAGSSVVLNANGGTTYQWSTGATTSSISVTPTMTSVYSVTSTVSGCTGSVTSSGTVTVNQLPNVVANANPTTICVGNTTSISATGASTYSWSTGGTSASFTAAPTGNITYTVTGTDANGCKKTVTKSIIVNPLPNVSLSLSDDSVCTNDASVTLTGSPTGGTYLGTAVSSNSFDPQSAGQGTFTLSYSYTDANNCSNSNSQVINVDVCTGILSHLSLDNVFVFPNPASTILHIKLPQEMLSAIYSIEIFDVIGKQVYSTKPTNVETICYINALANGIYNCRITTMEHKVITKRFVKE